MLGEVFQSLDSEGFFPDPLATEIHDALLLLYYSRAYSLVIQQSMSLEYEPRHPGRLFLAQMPTVLMQSMHCAQVPGYLAHKKHPPP